MLKSLSIWNFALIEFVKIDFDEKLNILTGETGAGKSILMEALGLAIGNRANLDTLRNGSDFQRVEVVFEINSQYAELKKFLNMNNIVLEDNYLIISRQINAQGRNTIQINNCTITLSVLKQIGVFLVDIHSQHSNQLLLKENYQLQLLDSYNFDAIAPLLNEYKNTYKSWRNLLMELDEYKINSQERAQRIDLLNWQIKDIKAANLIIGEDDKLEEEIKLLSNSEKIVKHISEANRLFMDQNEGNLGITSALDRLRKCFAQLSNFGSKYTDMVTIVEESYYQLKDIEALINEEQFSIDYSPEKLDEMQYRLNEIDKLKLKYGNSIADILDYLKRIEEEKTKLDNFEDNLANLNNKIINIEKKLKQNALILHDKRLEQGKLLSQAILKELTTLGISTPRLEFMFTEKNNYGVDGKDEVNILFSANLGDVIKPLNKIASGGELSRISLAIKTVMAGKDNIDVLVFDEIDTGVGGKTALMLSEKIAKISRHRQVICITHLPQIAAMADKHFYISKMNKENKTYTDIITLSKVEELKELSRMMSGIESDLISIENAKLLVNNAEIYKNKLYKEG